MVLHVSLFASAESTIFGKESSYRLTLSVDIRSDPFHPILWDEYVVRTQRDKFSEAELDVYGQVDGEFYDYVSDLRQFEESPCLVLSSASGKGANYVFSSTGAMDFVLEMPPDSCLHQSYTATLVPAAGYDYFATAGDTHEAILTTNLPYYSVTWYVKAPGDTSEKGTLVETDSGDTIQTEAWLNYTFPVGVAGEYTITAIVSWGVGIYTIELICAYFAKYFTHPSYQKKVDM